MDDAHIFRPGEIAADFVLPDSSGSARRLSDLAAGHKLILIFYRGYW
jgi:peroxiredoxin